MKKVIPSPKLRDEALTHKLEIMTYLVLLRLALIINYKHQTLGDINDNTPKKIHY
jgi:hypothetical protein